MVNLHLSFPPDGLSHVIVTSTFIPNFLATAWAVDLIFVGEFCSGLGNAFENSS